MIPTKENHESSQTALDSKHERIRKGTTAMTLRRSPAHWSSSANFTLFHILGSPSSENPDKVGQHGEPVAYVKALDPKAPLDQVDGHTAAHGAQTNKRDRGFGGFGVCRGEGEGGGGRLGGSHAHAGKPFEHLEHPEWI
jgi:hypothetical protein